MAHGFHAIVSQALFSGPSFRCPERLTAALYDLRPAAETVDFVMDRRSSGFELEPLPLGFPPERQAGVLHELFGGQLGRLLPVDDCRDDVRGKVGKPQQPGDIGG